jgi:hypothetical protein
MMHRVSTRGKVAVSAAIIMAVVIAGCSKEASFTTDDIPTDYRFSADTLRGANSGWANSDSNAGGSYLSRRLVAGTSPGPITGSYYTSRAFLWFLSLPDSTVDVTSAELYLYATAVNGSYGCGTFDIHTLADTLYQTILYWGNMPEPELEPVASFAAPGQDGDSLFVDVTDVVTSWIKNDSENLGFAIKGSEIANDFCLVEFASREVTRTTDISDGDTTVYEFRPALRIAYTDTAGEAQFYESIASADAFADTLIAFGEPPEEPQSLVCGNGFPSRAFIKFNILTLPIEATVTKAVLRLTPDLEGSVFDSIGVVCHAVLDTVWSGFHTKIGASGAGLQVLRRRDSDLGLPVGLDITGLVHPLVARKVSNYGFVIKSTGETSDLDFVSFFGSASADSSRHPRLEIDYLMPPDPPYSEE